MDLKMILVLFIMIPYVKAIYPGAFFWKPRLALDLTIPTTTTAYGTKVKGLEKKYLRMGLMVLVNGYNAGVTIIALAAGATGCASYPHLDMSGPYFWTNAYRWTLRYLSLLPQWSAGVSGNFVETVRTWRRRFYYMDEFIPKFGRKALFWVKPEEWHKEYLDWKRFKKYAESAFGKHHRYPNRFYNFFRSYETKETTELNYEEVSTEEIA